jgi:hypothetical protein
MAGRHERVPSSRADVAPPATLARNLILVASLIAVVAIVFVALHFTGSRGKSTTAGGPPAGSSSPGAGRPSSSGGSSGTPAATTSPVPVTSTTPRPSSSAPSPSPTRESTTSVTSPGRRAPDVPLLVLNNSTIDGLGLRAASDFRNGGWTVAGVGNLSGRLRDTTVYYEPGYAEQARALAAQFPQVHRVLPRIDGLPGAARLTVVVTRYYKPADPS